MLAELARYARGKEGLRFEAGFRKKEVRWLLLFRPDGTLIDILPLGASAKEGKSFDMCPHLQFSGDTPMRQFLVDTAQYLALLGGKGEDAKLRRKHNYAIDLLKQSATAVPELTTIAVAMTEPGTVAAIRDKLSALKAKPADNVTFAIALPNGEQRIFVDETSWHDWWRSFWPTLFAERAQAASGAAISTRCLISGDPCEPVLTHPKIRGLGDVGGKVETALVSFNQQAFCSFGLDQSANAAVGRDAANAYVGALNDLIENTGQRLGNVKVVHWYAGKNDRPAPLPREHDVLRILEDPNDPPAVQSAHVSPGAKKLKRRPTAEAEQQVDERAAQSAARDFLASVRSGKRADLAEYRYYALTLSGSSARVMVRDFVTGRFVDLCQAIEAWFDDLAIVHRDRRVGGLAPSPKFAAVLAGMVRDLKDIPAPVTAKLWHCAIRQHEAIPEAFAAQALRRASLDFIAGEPAKHARLGLLRAYLYRKGDRDVKPFLNEAHPDPAYHCGRILAVLDDIQYAALGNVGAGIVQRYYAAASATPALVLGRLVRLANTGHLPKLEGGLRHWHTQRLAQVWAQLQCSPPPTLSLEQQTLFAMGYYQQKAQPKTTNLEKE